MRQKGACGYGWGAGRQLTFTLQTLPQEAPEQGPTVVTEGGDLVVVDPKLVGHVDAEPLGAHLQGQQNIEWTLSCSAPLGAYPRAPTESTCHCRPLLCCESCMRNGMKIASLLAQPSLLRSLAHCLLHQLTWQGHTASLWDFGCLHDGSTQSTVWTSHWSNPGDVTMFFQCCFVHRGLA
jgi:hypothetical protein